MRLGEFRSPCHAGDESKYGTKKLRDNRPGLQVLTALRRIIRATDLHSKQLAREAGLTTPQAVGLRAARDLGEAFERLSPARQIRILTTLDEVAAMMGAAELDAAPLLDSGSPGKRVTGRSPR